MDNFKKNEMDKRTKDMGIGTKLLLLLISVWRVAHGDVNPSLS